MVRIATIDELLFWESMLGEDEKARLLAIKAPKRIGWKKVPESLNNLTLEQLVRFWNCKTTQDLFDTTAQVLLNMRSAKHAPVVPMLGLVNFVASELERINELWASIPSSHTPEEIQAGVGELKFGVFGIADWYARRMGMTNHDDAFKTPWVRIFQCMKNDAAETAYQRRLNQVYSKKK